MSYKPWRVCLRIGTDVIASNVHYESKEQAQKVQQQLLSSKTIQNGVLHTECKDKVTATDPHQHKIGVLVMHWKTFRKCCNEGTGVTIARLQQNERVFGKAFAKMSPSYAALCEAITSLNQETMP